MADSTGISAVKGYTFVEYQGKGERGDMFLACGTDGRLDRIFEDGTVENIPLETDADFTKILVSLDITLISGRSGTLFYSKDSVSFSSCGKITKSDILSLAQFKDKFYACASDGSLFVSKDGISWKQSKKLTNKPIIAMDSNDVYCMAITEDTDIFITEDGEDWKLENYNSVYAEFYEKYAFTNLINLGPTFFVLGFPVENPDYPHIMYSDSGGEVWMFKTLDQINDEELEAYLPMRINSVCVFGGELMGVCNDGRVLTITSCAECNQIMDSLNSDLRGIALSDDKMLVAGDDYQFEILDTFSLGRYNIKAEDALADYQYGAVIIDVRTEDEYLAQHILGCVNIPLEQITQRLPIEFADPGTELIFYGNSGEMVQSAIETAQQLGYFNVFNLGGLSDWPYETE